MTEEHEIDECIDIPQEPVCLGNVFEWDHEEKIPPGFTAATITLDGSMHSSLKWEKEQQKARNLAAQGYKILFELDLGLFKKLPLPLDSEMQLQTLCIACDHFQNHVVTEFQEQLLGVILLRSNLDFSCELLEAFDPDLLACRNAAVEYLELLASNLSPAVQPFILVDATTIQSPLVFSQLTAKDCFKRFQLAIKNPLFCQGWTTWQEGCETEGFIGKILPQINASSEPKIGIVLPHYDTVIPSAYDGLESVFDDLLDKKIPFKVIPEEFLTTEWSDLDALYVSTQGISTNGMRKLAGFVAAGGIIYECQKKG